MNALQSRWGFLLGIVLPILFAFVYEIYAIVIEVKKTQVYDAHPYCSGERGTNENNNRMIRRWIPKGTLIDNISTSFIKKIEDWINNYPREMFGYKSSNMILLEI